MHLTMRLVMCLCDSLATHGNACWQTFTFGKSVPLVLPKEKENAAAWIEHEFFPALKLTRQGTVEAMSLVDSAAVFEARARAIGIDEQVITQMGLRGLGVACNLCILSL